MSIFLIIWVGGLAIVVALAFVQTILLLAGRRETARRIKTVSLRLGEDILPGLVMLALLTAASLWFIRGILRFFR